MSPVPIRVVNRFSSALKRFQPIIQSAKSRDVNESDTVIVVTDMLCDLFGYDKYSEITSEFSIRGTYCDLATKVDSQVQCLFEVKAAGLELKDSHTRQALDYASNQGVEWVVLTNASTWKIYKVLFAKPIGQELVVEFDLLLMNSKSTEDLDKLYLLAKEGFQKSALGEFDAQRQALNRFCLAAVLLTDTILHAIRRELRRLSPDVKIDNDQIASVLVQEVLKRDALEGEKAEEAKRKVARVANRALKTKAASANHSSSTDVATNPASSHETPKHPSPNSTLP